MIIWAAVAVYLIGWYVAAPRIARHFTETNPRCHAADNWSQQHHCERWDGKDCWHSDEMDPIFSAMIGCAIALIWPVVFVIADVARRAKGKPSYEQCQRNIQRLQAEVDSLR